MQEDPARLDPRAHLPVASRPSIGMRATAKSDVVYTVLLLAVAIPFLRALRRDNRTGRRLSRDTLPTYNVCMCVYRASCMYG